VTISGGQKPAVRIQVNPTALSSYGISLEDLRNALVSTSVNSAKGTFDGHTQNYQINANDQLLSSKDYRDVLVAYKNGAAVTLSDVAKISDGVENVRLAGWMNQTPAVILNIQRQPGANTIAVVKSIEELLPKLQAGLPAGVQLTVLTDRTATIKASVDDVEFELILTIGLVVMVIFVFLRNLAATIIPAIAIPISLVGTLAVMYLLGYSLNNLTLMALTISTGFVVDDAIVMIENISRYLEQGYGPLEAALKGRRSDRLHYYFPHYFSYSRPHSVTSHGRYRRKIVPRVCNHACGDDSYLRRRIAHADPDDECSHAAAQARIRAGPFPPLV
jgi:multidrug efflux pump